MPVGSGVLVGISVMVFTGIKVGAGVKVFMEEVPVTGTVITMRPGMVGTMGRIGRSPHQPGVGASVMATVAGSAGGVQLLFPVFLPSFHPAYPNPARVSRSSMTTKGTNGFLCMRANPSNDFEKGLSPGGLNA